MARAVITGGAGFLGSHLSDRLLAEGYDVVIVDNLVTGSLDNIAHLRGNPRFEYVEQDVIQPYTVDGPVDLVYHFASPASPVDYLELPLETLLVGSVGTHHTLDLARDKGARFLMASTSEVYGDPTIHPQPEEYFGNVNPNGTRSVYDEAKRYAEAVTFAYRRKFGLDAKIVRIFNSILAHETVAVFDGDEMHLTAVEEFSNRLENEIIRRPHCLRVPAFDPATGCVALREASALIKHPPSQQDAFVLKTRYGRQIHVTGDHSVFRRDKHGKPEAIPVREIQVGDHVAIAGHMPVAEKDRPTVHIGEEWITRAASPAALWELLLAAPEMKQIISDNRDQVWTMFRESGRFDGSASPHNTAGCALRKCEQEGALPLFIWHRLRARLSLTWPAGARLRPYTGGSKVSLPCEVTITDDLLWFLGFFLAEGIVAHYADKATHFLTICSHEAALERATNVLRDTFGVRVGSVAHTAKRGASIYAHGKQLCWLMGEVLGLGGLSSQKRIPTWVMQLPLPRFKHFLEGYREGDGTHSGVNVGKRLNFVTTSRLMAQDLTYALLRFGLVASVGKYKSRLGRKSETNTKEYPFYSLTLCRLSSFDILTWDAGVEQTLNAGRFGDLVWARVNAIEPTDTTPYVYDFSVPECENFVAGTGVFAHNTYGPRMRLKDGRVVPAFISQALRGEALTVFGDGRQTRSFCYVSDLIDGIYKLSVSEQSGPINVGNPTERTMLQFAEEILKATGSDSPITYVPLPTADDPKQRRPDITKARALLGWEPRVPLEEGLKETIAYFKTKI